MTPQPGDATERVILSAFDDAFHRSKSGYYAVCGADFNPHHAARIERSKAERLDYSPCPECGFDD